jgi:hypothetical protein
MLSVIVDWTCPSLHLHALWPVGLMTAVVLRDLFAGYRFLHRVVGYVHRDLEDKHVGQADGRTCVFDLSTCVPLGTQPVTGYAGTGVSPLGAVSYHAVQVLCHSIQYMCCVNACSTSAVS